MKLGLNVQARNLKISLLDALINLSFRFKVLMADSDEDSIWGEQKPQF